MDGIKLIANPHAPDVFANNAASYGLVDGVLRVSFTAIKPVEIGGESAFVHIGNLVMPVEAARRMVIDLYGFLKSRDLDPFALVSTEDAKSN